MPMAKSPKLPDHQYQVLRAIYDWRVIGRRALAGEHKGKIEIFDGVPIYFIHAQLDGGAIDVETTLRLLEIKSLAQKPGHVAHYEGAWELPDGRIVTTKCPPLENDPNSPIIFCGVRTLVYVDGRLLKDNLNEHRTDLTAAGLELIENSPKSSQERQSRVDLRKRAERYVKTHGGIFPGVRALAKMLECPDSSLSNAIKDSRYLLARKAEHERETKTSGTQGLSEFTLDALKQSTEQDPLDALDELVAEQQADLREDTRRSRRSNRRS